MRGRVRPQRILSFSNASLFASFHSVFARSMARGPGAAPIPRGQPHSQHTPASAHPPLTIMSVALIQGGGGSLGSAFARHLLSTSRLNVVATSRDATLARRAILSGSDQFSDRLTVLEVDVKNENTIARAAKEVRERWGPASLRLLLNVSGVVSPEFLPRRSILPQLKSGFFFKAARG